LDKRAGGVAKVGLKTPLTNPLKACRMDEADDGELSLAELSSLLGAGTAPQGITVPVSMAVRALRDQRAINDFRRALELIFGSSAPAPNVAWDEMRPDSERKASYARLVGGLNALHYFLKQLDMQNLSAEFDELLSALEDALRGIRHPFFEPFKREGRRSRNSPSRIWRARANFTLAIEARRALLVLDKTKESVSKTFEEATMAILKITANLKLVRQISSKSARNRRLDKYEQIADEKNAITRMVRQWKKDLSSRARNGEAEVLFRVTLARIQDNKTNEKMLRIIGARCLKFAHIDGAIAGV
jgi:hypothetical protein